MDAGTGARLRRPKLLSGEEYNLSLRRAKARIRGGGQFD
jgi:hypothetical protein